MVRAALHLAGAYANIEWVWGAVCLGLVCEVCGPLQVEPALLLRARRSGGSGERGGSSFTALFPLTAAWVSCLVVLGYGVMVCWWSSESGWWFSERGYLKCYRGETVKGQKCLGQRTKSCCPWAVKGAASLRNGKDDEAESHRGVSLSCRGDGIPITRPQWGMQGQRRQKAPLSEAAASLQNHC